MNDLVIHTYQFLKLYLIHLYDNKKDFPIIDEDFVGYIFMVLTVRKCGSGGYTDKTMPEQLKLLTKFYNEHYKSLTTNDEVIYYDKLNYNNKVDIYNEILEIISNNFNTGDSLKELIKYVDKLMKVYLTDEKARKLNYDININSLEELKIEMLNLNPNLNLSTSGAVKVFCHSLISPD